MTPELALIFGFLLCAGIVGVVYFVYSYIDRRFNDFKIEMMTEFELRLNKIIPNAPGDVVSITPVWGEKTPETKPKRTEVFWNDASAIRDAINGIKNQQPDAIPNIPQLQNLSPNDAYHALKDREEELDA